MPAPAGENDDEVWILADDPEEEAPIWWPEDPGASGRAFRS